MTPQRTTAIVALDFPTADAALAMVDRLGDGCDFYKVGSELFVTAGAPVVAALRERGKRIFLDLKFHDIPNTVAGAVRSAVELGVSLLTVHASGGSRMVRAAVDAAGGRCDIFAVTVLTSLSDRELGAAWGRIDLQMPEEVERLAELAAGAGAAGVVCSGLEAPRLRARFGERLQLLVPGVRLPGDAAGDQTRIVTPAEAAAAGARYVILGRTVTAAPDPERALAQAVASLA
jgi:orotidine-5'-phosphate decarboxylase